MTVQASNRFSTGRTGSRAESTGPATSLRPFVVRSLARPSTLDYDMIGAQATASRPSSKENASTKDAKRSSFSSGMVTERACMEDLPGVFICTTPQFTCLDSCSQPLLGGKCHLRPPERKKVRLVRRLPDGKLSMRPITPLGPHYKLLHQDAKNGGAPEASARETLGCFGDGTAYSTADRGGWTSKTPLGWYSDALETQPLVLKCTTSAVIGGLGDICAQCLIWARGGNMAWHDGQAIRRTVAVAIDGFCFNAPFLHFAYDALDRWIPTEDNTAHAIAQVAVDVFILNPIYALVFIVTTGVIEGKSMEMEIIPTIRNEYPTLVFWLTAVGLLFAPPHVYLFKHLPLKWRVAIADGVDLLWTVVASFIIGPV